jgi:hypothetical protein
LTRGWRTTRSSSRRNTAVITKRRTALPGGPTWERKGIEHLGLRVSRHWCNMDAASLRSSSTIRHSGQLSCPWRGLA